MSILTERHKYDFCQRALTLKTDIELQFLALGAALSKIKKESLWEAGWGSWDEYEMELRMSAATISKLIRIYEIFHVQYGIPEKKLAQAGGWSVVSEYLPLVSESTSKNDVVGWIESAGVLSRADVRRNIMEEKTGVPMAKCKHKNTYTLRICRDCGQRHEEV